MHALTPSWRIFIEDNWSALAAGQHITVPTVVGHPRGAGFRSLGIAEWVGQARDWARSLPDGSRLHVHEHPTGQLVVHRDRHDPDQGFWSMVQHIATETTTGAVVGLALVGVGVFYGVKAVSKRG